MRMIYAAPSFPRMSIFFHVEKEEGYTERGTSVQKGLIELADLVLDLSEKSD
jgi:hypothetical protein